MATVFKRGGRTNRSRLVLHQLYRPRWQTENPRFADDGQGDSRADCEQAQKPTQRCVATASSTPAMIGTRPRPVGL